MCYPETADIQTSSEIYARRFEGPVGEWFLEVQNQAVLKLLAPYKSLSILDVGGGHGQLVGPLVAAGHKVTVFGSSEDCKFRVRHWLENGSADFCFGNLLEMPFHDRSFDVVISLRLLSHITHLKEFISELSRVADRAVIVDYPEIRSINYFAPYFFHLKKRLEPDTRKFVCYRRTDLLRVFEEFGFVMDAYYPQYFLPMSLHRKLKLVGFSRKIEAFFRLIGLTRLFGSPVILKVRRATLD
jgi:ubiquinone/menaquinone biosynthesis C-methylase UbiE